MIRVFSGDARCFLPGEIFDTLIGFEMLLDPEIFTLFIIPFKRVAAVAVHMPI